MYFSSNFITKRSVLEAVTSECMADTRWIEYTCEDVHFVFQKFWVCVFSLHNESLHKNIIPNLIHYLFEPINATFHSTHQNKHTYMY